MARSETTINIKGNFLKKLLIVGKTGTGKSALANRIAGRPHNDSLFPVSSEAFSCTQNTQFGTIQFGGRNDRLISLIDTIGFDDPDNDTDIKIIADLVDKLVNECDFVHQFIIAVNGQAPRMDGSLVAMIKIFQEMFTEAFWDRVVIVFTRVPMDKRSIRVRQNSSDGKTDDERAAAYIKVVEEKFPTVQGKKLKFLFLDSCHDEENVEEIDAFNVAMEELYGMIEAHSEGLPTSKINEEVQSEHGRLKNELEAKQRERDEMAKHVESVKEDLKKSEAKHQEEIAKQQEEIRKQREEMERIKSQMGRKKGRFGVSLGPVSFRF